MVLAAEEDDRKWKRKSILTVGKIWLDVILAANQGTNVIAASKTYLSIIYERPGYQETIMWPQRFRDSRSGGIEATA